MSAVSTSTARRARRGRPGDISGSCAPKRVSRWSAGAEWTRSARGCGTPYLAGLMSPRVLPCARPCEVLGTALPLHEDQPCPRLRRLPCRGPASSTADDRVALMTDVLSSAMSSAWVNRVVRTSSRAGVHPGLDFLEDVARGPRRDPDSAGEGPRPDHAPRMVRDTPSIRSTSFVRMNLTRSSCDDREHSRCRKGRGAPAAFRAAAR